MAAAATATMAAAATATTAALSSLSLNRHLSSQPSIFSFSFSLLPPKTPTLIRARPTSSPFPLSFKIKASSSSGDIDTTFFDNVDPNSDIPFEPITPPEGYVPPPYFDDGPAETEDEIAAAYEELYGPAYSGVSILGNNINVMDAKIKKATGFGSKRKKEKVRDGFDERVVQVRRVTKVVKGGKQLSFRAIVVVGDKQGQVGVGVGKAKEVVSAVEKSATNARRNIITVPMTKYSTFPHRSCNMMEKFITAVFGLKVKLL